MKRWLVAPVLVGMLLLSGCDSLPTLPPLPPNPFAATPEVAATPLPISSSPIVFATPSPPPFSPYWVKNHRLTEMWSGPPNQPGVISFGTTSSQFCVFQVVRPQEATRLYVLNPYSKNYFWIDADAIGPVSDPPQRASGPKPDDKNCAEQLYD